MGEFHARDEVNFFYFFFFLFQEDKVDRLCKYMTYDFTGEFS